VSKKTKVGPFSVLALLREFRTGKGDPRPLAVAGARELVPILARELRAGGEAGAVVEGNADAAVLVWVGAPDEKELRAAARRRTPIVAVTDDATVPYVLATHIVHLQPGQGFPVEEIAEAIADSLGEAATSLAARLPVMRRAVCEKLIKSFSLRNGLIGAVVFVPGVDMPLLTLNQARLVLRIGLAYGVAADGQRAGELAAVVGAGFGFRAIARELLDLIPFFGWLVKGGVAFVGTRAVGEAAIRYYEARA
jgi:uncharacterized protein (DUF697 family)